MKKNSVRAGEKPDVFFGHFFSYWDSRRFILLVFYFFYSIRIPRPCGQCYRSGTYFKTVIIIKTGHTILGTAYHYFVGSPNCPMLTTCFDFIKIMKENREKKLGRFCIFPEIFPFFSQNGQIIRPF